MHHSPPNINPVLFDFWYNRPANHGFHFVRRPHPWPAATLQGMKRHEMAKLGESVVSLWAHWGGLKIIYQRLRRRGFELDLVTRLKKNVTIVEVKTRLNPRTAPSGDVLASWMNFYKKKYLQSGARYILSDLIRRYGQPDTISCDLVVVDIFYTQHLNIYRWPDAFSLETLK